jgi:hypothetical protein
MMIQPRMGGYPQSPYMQPRTPILPTPQPGEGFRGIGPAARPPILIGPEEPGMPSFKKGGKVPRTGKYLLHKDEHVVPKGKRKMTDRKPELVSVGVLKG